MTEGRTRYRVCAHVLPRCVLAALVLSVAVPVFAQSVLEDQPYLSGSGSDYKRAVRFRGIDTDVTYYDPLEPLPPLTTDARPDHPVPRETPDNPPPQGAPDRAVPDSGGGDWSSIPAVVIAVAAAVLLGLAYLVYRHGGGLGVSLKREVANPRRQHGGMQAEDELPEEAVPGSLDEVLRIGDRQRALILLARSALARVLDAHGVLLQRSWTARDALRHIPAGQDHMAALRMLILASERVHFGGRTVSEGEFDEIVAQVRPLFGASGA